MLNSSRPDTAHMARVAGLNKAGERRESALRVSSVGARVRGVATRSHADAAAGRGESRVGSLGASSSAACALRTEREGCLPRMPRSPFEERSRASALHRQLSPPVRLRI